MEEELRNDLSYLQKEEAVNQALNQIRKITVVEAEQSSVYKRIPELNELMETVCEGHGRLLEAKRVEILEIIRQCLAEIHTLAGDVYEARTLSESADKFFEQQKARVAELKSLQLLDGLVPQLCVYKDEMVDKIDSIIHLKTPVVPPVSYTHLDVYKRQVKKCFTTSCTKYVASQAHGQWQTMLKLLLKTSVTL